MSDNCDTEKGLSRRRWLLATGTAGSVALSGCLGGDDDSDGNSLDDDSNGADDQNGGDDANGDGDDAKENAGDEPNGDDEPGALSLSELIINHTDDTVELPVDINVPITLTAANDGGGEEEFTISLAITERNPDDEDNAVVIEESETLTLEAGSETDVTFDGITPDLDAGSYDVTVTGEGGDTVPDETELSGQLVIGDFLELTVHVYTVTAEEENRPDSGTVLIHHDEEVVAEKSLDGEQSPTFELADARDRSYTVEVQDIDGGVYPPEEQTLTVDSYEPLEIELVAGYEFQTADSFNFTFHWQYDDASSEDYGRGSLAANDNFFIEYALFSRSISAPLVDSFDDPLPDFGVSVREIEGGTPRTGIKLDEQRYYRGLQEDSFSERSEPFRVNQRFAAPEIVRQGIYSFTDSTPEERRFIEQTEFRGKQVDVYETVFEIRGRRYDPKMVEQDSSADSEDFQPSRIFVDPDTGYVLRVQIDVVFTGDGTPDYSGFQMWEFYDHNEVEDIDLGLVRGRFDPDEGN